MLAQGSRIRAFVPVVGRRITGTLCGLYKSPRSGRRRWLMVTDEESTLYQAYPEIGIPNSTVFIDTDSDSRSEVALLDPNLDESWVEVPPQVGVFTTQDFQEDGAVFPIGTVGRVIHFSGHSRVLAMWNNPAIPGWRDEKKRPSRLSWEIPYLLPWEIPAQYIGIGLVNLSEGRVVNMWDAAAPSPIVLKPKFKIGDLVTYMSSRSMRVAGKDNRNYAVVKGTVLIVSDIDRTTITAMIIGNCQEKMIGVSLRIDNSSVIPFPFTWIPEGKKVRVTKDIMFRKRSMHDQIGIVLSSTDQDGDVGVQFSEDIGAGSLDGLGHDGSCLYIPAQALEVSE